MERLRAVRSKVMYLVSFGLTSVFLLLWSTVAHAQSRDDQYGSPTDTADAAGRLSDTISVLPDTGGPLILFAGVALVVAGTGMGLVRQRARYR